MWQFVAGNTEVMWCQQHSESGSESGSSSHGKISVTEYVSLVLPTGGCINIMSTPRTQGMMDEDSKIWSQEAKVALLEQVR